MWIGLENVTDLGVGRIVFEIPILDMSWFGNAKTELWFPEDIIELLKAKLLLMDGSSGDLTLPKRVDLDGIFLKYPLSLSSAIENKEEGIDITFLIVY